MCNNKSRQELKYHFLNVKCAIDWFDERLKNLRGESCEFLFVDGSLIDGVGNREVDEFAAKTHYKHEYSDLTR